MNRPLTLAAALLLAAPAADTLAQGPTAQLRINPAVAPQFELGVQVSPTSVPGCRCGRCVPTTWPAVPGSPRRGMLIRRVVPGSAAARMGLEPGDVILTVNSITVETVDRFQAALDTSDGHVVMRVRDVRRPRVVTVHGLLDQRGGNVL